MKIFLLIYITYTTSSVGPQLVLLLKTNACMKKGSLLSDLRACVAYLWLNGLEGRFVLVHLEVELGGGDG